MEQTTDITLDWISPLTLISPVGVDNIITVKLDRTLQSSSAGVDSNGLLTTTSLKAEVIIGASALSRIVVNANGSIPTLEAAIARANELGGNQVIILPPRD